MDAVIFDLDGTLTANQDQIRENYRYALEQILPDIHQKQIQDALGKSLDTIGNMFDLNNNQIEEFKAHYNEYDKITVAQTKLHENALDLLTALKENHVPMAVVTSKLEITAKRLIHHLKISKFFNVVITINDVNNPKPDPEGLVLARRKMNLTENDDLFYVGDSQSDITAAFSAGITPIAVTWGVTGSLFYSLYPDLEIANSVNDIFKILKLID